MANRKIRLGSRTYNPVTKLGEKCVKSTHKYDLGKCVKTSSIDRDKLREIITQEEGEYFRDVLHRIDRSYELKQQLSEIKKERDALRDNIKNLLNYDNIEDEYRICYKDFEIMLTRMLRHYTPKRFRLMKINKKRPTNRKCDIIIDETDNKIILKALTPIGKQFNREFDNTIFTDKKL